MSQMESMFGLKKKTAIVAGTMSVLMCDATSKKIDVVCSRPNLPFACSEGSSRSATRGGVSEPVSPVESGSDDMA